MLEFLKPKEVVKKLEVEISPGLRALAANLQADEHIASLRGHPGFERILAELKFQRSVLETRLRNEFHVDLSQVTKLQAGIYWLNWIERRLDAAIKKTTTAPVELSKTETDLFNEIKGALEGVGQ